MGAAAARRPQAAALGCAERLSELYLELGNVRETEALCNHVLREEPCHEPVARRLMLAYARLGQPHMALREYDRIVHELDRDLGVRAAAETVALPRRSAAVSPSERGAVDHAASERVQRPSR